MPVPGAEAGTEEPLTVILNRLSSGDREHRRAVAEAVTESLKPELKTRAFIFNTLLQDKAIGDRLRGYPHWLASRNLSNEASDESVQALITAVKERYEIGRRWYRLKAKLLGVDQLADYDRVAVVTADDARIRGRRAATSCSTPTAPSARTLAHPRSGSSPTATSMRRHAPASAAGRSARTPCRRATPTSS